MRSMARLRRIAQAQAKREQQTCLANVRVLWSEADGVEIPPGDQAAVMIRLQGGGGKGPGWEPDRDGGARLTVGEVEPKPRKGQRQPAPEVGSTAWYRQSGLYVGDQFTNPDATNPALMVLDPRLRVPIGAPAGTTRADLERRDGVIGVNFKPLRSREGWQ